MHIAPPAPWTPDCNLWHLDLTIATLCDSIAACIEMVYIHTPFIEHTAVYAMRCESLCAQCTSRPQLTTISGTSMLNTLVNRAQKCITLDVHYYFLFHLKFPLVSSKFQFTLAKVHMTYHAQTLSKSNFGNNSWSPSLCILTKIAAMFWVCLRLTAGHTSPLAMTDAQVLLYSNPSCTENGGVLASCHCSCSNFSLANFAFLLGSFIWVK